MIQILISLLTFFLKLEHIYHMNLVWKIQAKEIYIYIYANTPPQAKTT
jgi:hypothetical protein